MKVKGEWFGILIIVLTKLLIATSTTYKWLYSSIFCIRIQNFSLSLSHTHIKKGRRKYCFYCNYTDTLSAEKGWCIHVNLSIVNFQTVQGLYKCDTN